jgi:hypothetical protein
VGHAGNHQVGLDFFNALELVVVVGLFDNLGQGHSHFGQVFSSRASSAA